MNLLASLPWYDHPRSSTALDLFWEDMRSRLVRAGFVGAPDRLDRSMSLVEQWRDPGLLISQCCGPDLFTEPAAGVSCLGRPVFTDLECPPGYYYSHIVSLGALVSNPAIAINSPTSWSGNRALGQWLAVRGEGYSSCIISGSHQNSLDLLRAGRVDLVAIDAHTWRLMGRAGLHVIGRSDVAATPPFITGIKAPEAREAIRRSLMQSIASDGSGIGISELHAASKLDYHAIVSGYRLDACSDSVQEQLAAHCTAVSY